METNKNENFKEVLLVDKHKHYIKNLDFQKDSFFYWATEHLKVSGVYWGLGAMEMLKSVNEMDRDKIIEFVLSCQQKDGGFGGNVDHDSHLLYTLSAVQVLAILGAIDKIDKEVVINFVKSLQKDDGSFSGDQWGEIDTRFSYIALCTLALLHRLDAVNIEKAVEFILRCKNFDGGFGCVPGAESHAALAIAGKLDQIDADLLGWWLAERQLPGGGLNGRPEKLPDVCYSWWVLSSLATLDRLHWINADKLKNFILECQDEEGGGIGDRPNDMVDVYHTFFGVGGEKKEVDPVYALCGSTLQKMGVSWKRLKDY